VSRTVARVLLIAAVSIACETTVLLLMPAHDSTDSLSYIIPARNLAAGRGFRDIDPPAYLLAPPGYPIREGPDVIRTPGYPLVIALFGLIGTIVFQHLLVVAMSVALYFFARRATRSDNAALFAALTFACFLPMARTANVLLSEVPFIATLFAAVIAVDAATRRDSVPLAVFSGILLGAAVLIRPAGIYFFIPVTAVLFVARKPRVAAAFAIAALLLPAAWIARNNRLAGAPAICSVAGENLLLHWGGAVEVTRDWSHLDRLMATEAQSGYRAPIHRRRLVLFERAMELARADGVDPTAVSSAVRSRYEARLARQILFAQPIVTAELVMSAAIEVVFNAPALALTEYVRIPTPIAIVIVVIAFAFVVAGIVSIARRDRTLALLLAAGIFYFSFMTLPESDIRFSIVFAPFYCIAFAAGIEALARRRGSKGPS